MYYQHTEKEMYQMYDPSAETYDPNPENCIYNLKRKMFSTKCATNSQSQIQSSLLKRTTRTTIHPSTHLSTRSMSFSKTGSRRTTVLSNTDPKWQDCKKVNGVCHEYIVVEKLGSGTFGQVCCCKEYHTGRYCAVKIIKDNPLYFRQGLTELDILKKITTYTTNNHLLKVYDSLLYNNHLCLVLPQYALTLFDLMRKQAKKSRKYGLPLYAVQRFTRQLTEALVELYKIGITHCDLKPENIMIQGTPRTFEDGTYDLSDQDIIIIDFGSATETFSGNIYIQSRFYRAPEVILGNRYNQSIDMWSLGCIVAEMLLGLPLYAAKNELAQLHRIQKFQGPVPVHLIASGANAKLTLFYSQTPEGLFMKPITKENKLLNDYWSHTNLTNLLKRGGRRKSSQPVDQPNSYYGEPTYERLCCADFIEHCLELDPFKRWKPDQAMGHPFVVGQKHAHLPWDPPRSTLRKNKSIPPHTILGKFAKAHEHSKKSQTGHAEMNTIKASLDVNAIVNTPSRTVRRLARHSTAPSVPTMPIPFMSFPTRKKSHSDSLTQQQYQNQMYTAPLSQVTSTTTRTPIDWNRVQQFGPSILKAYQC